MKVELGIRNIVLVGAFETTIFDKFFFIKNQIFSEEELVLNPLPQILGGIQLAGNSYHFLATPGQIVVTSKIAKNNDALSSTVHKIIDITSLSKINAIGFNFNWFLSNPPERIETLSRRLFFSNEINLLSTHFNTEDSAFGLYTSRQFKEARLKLDIKPHEIQSVSNGSIIQQVLNFGFNFHFDTGTKTKEEILSLFEDYSSYKTESEQIISIYK